MERSFGEKQKKNHGKRITYKISPESEKYATHLEMNKIYFDSPEEGRCFGSSEIMSIKNSDEFIKAKRGEETNIPVPSVILDRYTEEDLVVRKNTLIKQTKEHFLLRSEHPMTSKPAKEIFFEAFENKTLDAELQLVLEKSSKELHLRDSSQKMAGPDKPAESLSRFNEKERNAELLIYALRSKILDDETWIKILDNHRVKFLEKSKEFSENIEPEFRDKLLISLTEMFSGGIIPITMERILKTVELTTVKIDDAMEHWFGENSGSYDAELNLVLIGSGAFHCKENLYHIYSHEMFHALSGKTIRVISNDDFEEIQSPDRIGLRIVEKFRWLNEAITESLTQIVVNKEMDFYTTERKILNFIIKKSELALQDFVNAYFEHYKPEGRGSETGAIANWKNLNNEISSRLGKRFLQKLDDKIKSVGVKKAFESLQEGGV